jgi:hypothetical protein
MVAMQLAQRIEGLRLWRKSNERLLRLSHSTRLIFMARNYAPDRLASNHHHPPFIMVKHPEVRFSCFASQPRKLTD